jgi:hypothetical protein
MNHYMCLYLFVLFVVFTPGVFVILPPGGSKLVVAATHGALFILVHYLTYKSVMNATRNL